MWHVGCESLVRAPLSACWRALLPMASGDKPLGLARLHVVSIGVGKG